MKLKSGIYLASTIFLLFFLAINFYFASAVMKPELQQFPFDNNIRWVAQEIVAYFEHFLADADQSILTGDCTDARVGVDYTSGELTFRKSNVDLPTEEIVQVFNEMAELHHQSPGIIYRHFSIEGQPCILAGRVLGTGGSLNFSGHLTKRSYFMEQAADWFGLEAEGSMRHELRSMRQGNVNFFLVDVAADTTIYLYGPDGNEPVYTPSDENICQIPVSFHVIPDMQIVACYPQSYSQTFRNQILFRTVVSVMLIVVMGIVFFMKKRV